MKQIFSPIRRKQRAGSQPNHVDNANTLLLSTGVSESSQVEFDRNAAADHEFCAKGLSENETDEICQSLSTAKDIMQPVSTVCLVLLTLMAISYSLYFCKPVMLPIVAAFLLNFLFSPVVAKLHRVGVPYALGALFILAATLGALCLLVLFAYDPAKDWLANRDENIVVVESKLMSLRKPLEQLRDVSEKIDKITTSAKPNKKPVDPNSVADSSPNKPTIDETGKEKESVKTPEVITKDDASYPPLPEINRLNPPSETESLNGAGTQMDSEDSASAANENTVDEPSNNQAETEIIVAKPVPVEVRQPSISSRIFSTTGDVLIGFSLMIVLLFYLLASGDRGLEKLIALMPNWRQKRRTVELSRAIEKSVSAYLLTTTLINFGLGVVIGTGMWLIGMPNPVLWGVMAMMLNYFPFIGAIIGAAIVFVVAVVTFHSVAFAALAPVIYLMANLIEANFITPVLLGRSVSLHPVWLMIFFVVVSWVWGLGGAIVAVPVLAVIKITCDHVEPLMPLGTFLGR